MDELENTNSLMDVFNTTLNESLNTENNIILEKMFNKNYLVQSLLNYQIKKQLNEDNIGEYKIINIINNQVDLFDIINSKEKEIKNENGIKIKENNDNENSLINNNNINIQNNNKNNKYNKRNINETWISIEGEKIGFIYIFVWL